MNLLNTYKTNIVIYGDTGSGKTELVKTIVENTSGDYDQILFLDDGAHPVLLDNCVVFPEKELQNVIGDLLQDNNLRTLLVLEGRWTNPEKDSEDTILPILQHGAEHGVTTIITSTEDVTEHLEESLLANSTLVRTSYLDGEWSHEVKQ